MKRLSVSHGFYFVLLLGFWLILSQEISLEILLVGSGAVVLIMLYSRSMLYGTEDTSLFQPRKLMFFFKFILIMLIEILKSNIQVAKIVLSPSLPISPSFVKVKKTFKKDLHKVIYANSVTLTPGTLTVDVDEEGFLVHALTNDAAEGLKDGIIEKSVDHLEVK